MAATAAWAGHIDALTDTAAPPLEQRAENAQHGGARRVHRRQFASVAQWRRRWIARSGGVHRQQTTGGQRQEITGGMASAARLPAEGRDVDDDEARIRRRRRVDVAVGDPVTAVPSGADDDVGAHQELGHCDDAGR